MLGILLVWPFVFDSCFTFLRRLRRRENVFEAHRSHLYQRLVAAGWSHQRVSILYLGLALAGGLLVRMGYGGTARIGSGGVGLLLVLALCLWTLVLAQERKPSPKTEVTLHPKERP